MGNDQACLSGWQQAAEPAELLIGDDAIMVFVEETDHLVRVLLICGQPCFLQHPHLQSKFQVS